VVSTSITAESYPPFASDVSPKYQNLYLPVK